MLRCRPTTEQEQRLRDGGLGPVAGVDEAGRGALAGPVVAGAVVADWCTRLPWHDEVRDSKQLSASQRERLFERISSESMAVAAGVVSSSVIDRIGIAAATRRAMQEALQSLAVQPGYVLIDWLTLPRLRLRQEGIPKGDALCLSIACASIVAKVTRDRLMDELDGRYPGYGFGAHKGYGTEQHLQQLATQGASPAHRVTFRPVRLVVGGLL